MVLRFVHPVQNRAIDVTRTAGIEEASDAAHV